MTEPTKLKQIPLGTLMGDAEYIENNYLRKSYADFVEDTYLRKSYKNAVRAALQPLFADGVDLDNITLADVIEGFRPLWDEVRPIEELCFTATQDNAQVSLLGVGALTAATFETSETGKSGTWSDYTLGTPIALAKEGDKQYFRAKTDNTGIARSKSGTGHFLTFGYTDTYGVAVSGNIMSMLSPNFKSLESAPDFAFYKMFANSGVTSCKGLNLPLETLTTSCYEQLFYGCTSLEDGSLTIGATELGESCFFRMFFNCSKMTVGPESIISTTTKTSCYEEMFNGCTNLVSTPVIVADNISESCFSKAFFNCSKLENANITLNSNEAVMGCYSSMFEKCASLKKAPALTNLVNVAQYSMENMFNGCASLKISEDGTEGDVLLSIPEGTTLPTKTWNGIFTGTSGTFTGTPVAGKVYRQYQ